MPVPIDVIKVEDSDPRYLLALRMVKVPTNQTINRPKVQVNVPSEVSTAPTYRISKAKYYRIKRWIRSIPD